MRRLMKNHRNIRPLRSALIVSAICAPFGIAACGGDGANEGASAPSTIPQPTRAQMVAAGLEKLPVAPKSKRVDITAPTFSNPTDITNPLFPVSRLRSVIFSGKVDGEPFHTETTLLPETRIIEWSPGQEVEARVSQYFAYLGGRIEEVALDYYAQADDGSVWYLGEDVYDYDRGGLVDSTLGSWLAGREGPPEMIMPADPKVGDVHRAENIPAIAFEEVEVKTTDKTVDGPAGPVEGAIVGRELHDDGTYSDKVFAPGYGEFFTGHGGEVEALALAVPTDALEGSPPAELEALSRAAAHVVEPARSGNWELASTGSRTASRAWAAYQREQVPPRLAAEMNRALGALSSAIDKRDRARAGTAAIDVAQSALDLELRYRPPAEVDLGRFELWANQVLVDVAAGDVGGVRGDVTTMEWIRDRFARTLAASDLTAIDAHLVTLHESVANGSEDLRTARAEAAELRDPLALGPVKARD
jgi:hypothetical protein